MATNRQSTTRAIFVSYRRSDSADVTGRIFDRLKGQFGPEQLFKDVDSIPLGMDFRSVISDAVGRCDVLLAIIGPDWLTATDDQGQRRIVDAHDYVHLEIAAALERKIPIVPILVEGAVMPKLSEIPSPLNGLVFRNGASVRPDPDFHNDMDRIIRDLSKYLRIDKSTNRRKLGSAAVVAAVLLIVALGFAVLRSPRAPTNGPKDTSVNTPTGAPPVVPTSVADVASVVRMPIRYWIDDLPAIDGNDAAKLFSNALGSWQAVVTTPIRRADSQDEANVIITTASDTIADALVGPPTPANPLLKIRFGTNVDWTSRSFEAASCRMVGHVLGLGYTPTPNQVMSEPSKMKLEDVPLTPQSDDIARVREVWAEVR